MLVSPAFISCKKVSQNNGTKTPAPRPRESRQKLRQQFFPKQRRPFCTAIITRGLPANPPGVLPVGFREMWANPHAHISLPNTQKVYRRNSAKTPAPHPSQTVTFTRIVIVRGAIVERRTTGQAAPPRRPLPPEPPKPPAPPQICI